MTLSNVASGSEPATSASLQEGSHYIGKFQHSSDHRVMRQFPEASFPFNLKYEPQNYYLEDPVQRNYENSWIFMRDYSAYGNQADQSFYHSGIYGGSGLDQALESGRIREDSSEESVIIESRLRGDEDTPPRVVMSKSMKELDELLTKLNPLAEEFIPPKDIDEEDSTAPLPEHQGNSRKKSFSGVKGTKNQGRHGRLQREDNVRRTVYVADIDQQVTEEQLAGLFITCGQVVDCRVCGDPNSVLRFAFVEFTDEDSASRALDLSGTVLGYYPLRVLPSKTAIVPVNPTFLPRSEDERELCARTIYCANIDKKVTQADVKLFFESLCGEVSRIRLLGDYNHVTRIAFVEFVVADSALAALNCSGAILGSMPIRVSPSKTPVRPRNPRTAA